MHEAASVVACQLSRRPVGRDGEHAQDGEGDGVRQVGGHQGAHRDARTGRRGGNPPRFDVFEGVGRKQVERQAYPALLEAGARPVPRCVERYRAADAEMRPQQRARQARRHRPVDPDRDLAGDGDAGQGGVDAVRRTAVENERGKRGRRRQEGVAERARDLVAAAVTAGLGQRSPASSENDPSRDQRTARSVERESLIHPRDGMDASPGSQNRAGVCEPRQQRVQHLPRPVGIWEQFTQGLLVQRHAELPEERDGLGDREPAQHAAYDGALSAPEVGLGDDRIRDVAPAAAADEDLGARPGRAVEQEDVRRRRRPACEDGRCQAGGPGADDRHVTGLWEVCQNVCSACGRPS